MEKDKKICFDHNRGEQGIDRRRGTFIDISDPEVQRKDLHFKTKTYK